MILNKNLAQRLFDYDFNSGHLIWRMPLREDYKSENGWRIAVTKKAGKSVVQTGGLYKSLRIFNKIDRVHRVVWVWHNGHVPDGFMVDHINGDPSDNRIDNLRLVTAQQNARNQKLRSTNKSGATGVHFCKRAKRWIASITIEGRSSGLGQFARKEEAIIAATIARQELNFSDRHIDA